LWRYNAVVVKGPLNKKCKEKSRSFDIPNKIREDGWACSGRCGRGRAEDISGRKTLEDAGGHHKNSRTEQVLAFAYVCSL
jgi:hypothetical protein